MRNMLCMFYRNTQNKTQNHETGRDDQRNAWEKKKKKSQDWALRCSKCLESLWLKKLYWLWPTVWKTFSILTPYMNMRAHTWNRNFTKEYLLSLHVIFSDILSFISFLVFYQKKKKKSVCQTRKKEKSINIKAKEINNL